MRPVLAAQLCLAVFQAFLLAPVQHVHETPDGGAAGEHSTVIHSHFSAHFAIPIRDGGLVIDDNDGAEAWSLDTFTIVLPMGMNAVVPSLAPDLIYDPRAIVGATVAVDERAHDPPLRDSFIPRAPPA